MLSAIVSRLQDLRKQPKSDRRHDMMNLCVLAYPDLLPWQVRKACIGYDTNEVDSIQLSRMYYDYLSLLLHPSEGHDAARQDAELVTVSSVNDASSFAWSDGGELTRSTLISGMVSHVARESRYVRRRT